MPMMTSTTRSSISVNPDSSDRKRCCNLLMNDAIRSAPEELGVTDDVVIGAGIS
jgi:hypothetical protein